jgi:hypothetical protein
MIATSAAQRIPAHTAPSVNEEIRRQTEMRIAYFAAHPDQIPARLRELDEEWDIEQTLETGSSIVTLAGLVAALISGRRRWLLLPMMVQGFFLQHALEGWCPPLPLLRRAGLRTRAEIEAERYALKGIKGDFRELSEDENLDAQARAERALRAVDDGAMGRRAQTDAPLFKKPPEPREEGSLPPTDTGPTS